MTLRNTFLYGTLLTLLSGCAVSSSVKEDSPIELTETASAIKPDLEKSRADAYWKDLSDRVGKFGGAIKEEAASGQLKLELSPLSEQVEHLNATYKPSIEEDSAEITIQCQPEYQECFTDAVEHELGHHLYAGLSEEQRIKIDAAVARRLNEPDAQAFQEETAQIELRYMKLSEILRKIAKPVAECKILRDDLTFGKAVLEELDEGGIILSLEQVELLRKKAERYAAYMPSCTPENLKQAQADLSQVEEAMKILVTQIKQIYHQKISLSPEQLPDFTITTFPLEPIAQEKFKEFYGAGNEYVGAIKSVVATKASNTMVARGSATEKALTRAIFKTAISMANRGSPLMGLMLGQLQLMLGGHDSQTEEQFSAVVDSLADSYWGPIVTAPMKVQLDEPLLLELEQLEYKGQQVLAPLVEEYRLKPKEEPK